MNRKLTTLIASLALPLMAAPATAADLLNVKVDRVDGVFVMRSEVWFDASLEAMYDTFLDWDLSTEFSSIVVESRNVPPDETGMPGFYSKARGCLMFFCMTFERNGYVEVVPLETIKATVDPERSDFHVGKETWQFRRDGSGTIVTYDMEMKPKFWVPPVIGPYAIKRKLRNAGTDALDRIEAIAQERSAQAR